MPIQIPMFLVNQTGPEWDKFVIQAKKAGAEVNDIGQIANEVFDNLVKRKINESRVAVDKLADSFAKSETSLRGMVKTANALNITPRGFEMTAYRLSGLVEGLGAAAVPLGTVAVAVGSITAAIGELASRGDPSMQQMNESTRELSRSWHDFLYEIGKTGTVQTVIGGIAASLSGMAMATKTASDAFSVGVPLVKEYFYTLTNQMVEADAARREMFAASSAADANRDTMFNPEAMADSRLKASGALGKIGDSERSRLRNDEFSKLTDKGEIEARIAKSQEFLSKASMFGVGGRPDAVAKGIKEAEETVRAGRERMLAIDKEHANLSERLGKFEEDRARLAKDPTPFRMAEDVTKEIEDQQKILGDVNRKLEERKASEEKIKYLVKEETDLKREQAQREREATEFKEHQLEVQREINREIARDVELRRQAAQAERARIEIREADKFKGQIEGQLGGQDGMKAALQNLDPRKVREQIAAGRDKTVVENMTLRQQKERDAFQGTDAQREGLERRQRQEMTRERQRGRAGAFRDFNKGNVGQGEMLEGQSEVMGKMIKDAAGKNKISAKMADVIQNLNEATKANIESNRQLEAELSKLDAMTNATANAAKMQAIKQKGLVN
jgi:hypothetical protein